MRNKIFFACLCLFLAQVLTACGETKKEDVPAAVTEEATKAPTSEPTKEPTSEPTKAPEENEEMRDLTTMELVRDMGIGINLGNTFESCGSWITGNTPTSFETAWGSPVITEAMIAGMADAGFGVLRIPVAWSNMMGDDYTISEAYI